MDPLQLLTRSARQPKGTSRQIKSSLPSSGPIRNPQLYATDHDRNGDSTVQTASRKRKRGPSIPTETGGIDETDSEPANFFADDIQQKDEKSQKADETDEDDDLTTITPTNLSEEERRARLRQHKLRVTLLYDPQAAKVKEKKKKKEKKKRKETKDKSKDPRQLYPEPLQDFDSLRTRYGISKTVLWNIRQQGYSTPTEVQMASLPILLGLREAIGETSVGLMEEQSNAEDGQVDLLTVAPTGSGKTLAYMIPVIHHLCLQRKSGSKEGHLQAMVLVPTKELVSQIVREGQKMSSGTGVKIGGMQKGMKLDSVDDDILVTTPMTLVNTLAENADDKSLSKMQHFILDEADVLLDPMFRDQTMAVWDKLSHPSLRTSLWSATIGSNIEELVRNKLASRATNLSENSSVTQPPLVRLVVGLKDSAVPNIHHKLIYTATEQGKLMALRELLHPGSSTSPSKTKGSSSSNTDTILRAPFIVFTQTIDRATALHNELRYDIPLEAGGLSRIAVLHSSLSDTARDRIMTGFRKGEIWVLITTDLLARGVDFRGVNGVVNFDIPSSPAGYVHRVGRTGRAGREGGVAVTFYTREDIQYVKGIANVIAAAQKQRGGEAEDEMLPGWLLDALPDVSKRERKELKKKGVEGRRSGKAKISTKSGYERRAEGNRRAAIEASRKRAENDDEEKGADTDFGGFGD